KMLAWMSERPAAQDDPNQPKPKPSDWADLKSWTTEPMLAAAFALAQDQLVVAASNRKTHKLEGYRPTDGSTLWTIDLPRQAVMKCPPAGRNGPRVVALCDGSVICVGR